MAGLNLKKDILELIAEINNFGIYYTKHILSAKVNSSYLIK